MPSQAVAAVAVFTPAVVAVDSTPVATEAVVGITAPANTAAVVNIAAVATSTAAVGPPATILLHSARPVPVPRRDRAPSLVLVPVPPLIRLPAQVHIPAQVPIPDPVPILVLVLILIPGQVPIQVRILIQAPDQRGTTTGIMVAGITIGMALGITAPWAGGVQVS